MATYPGWASLNYQQRMGVIQQGNADMQGNVPGKPTPATQAVQGPNYSGSGGPGSSVVTDPLGHQQSVVTPNLLPQQHGFELDSQNNQAKIDAAAAQQQQQAQADQLRLKSQLAADAEARRIGSIQTLSASTAPAAVSGAVAPDESAAVAAQFARAKDAAGQNALASLHALEDVMAGRGLRGSSIEGNLTADVLNGANGEIGDTIRSQMIQGASRAGQVADRNYAGSITQRGQDISRQASLLGLLNATGAY